MTARWVAAFLLAVFACVGLVPAAAADKATERELKALRGKIEQVNTRIARDVRRRDDGLAELKTLDLSIQSTDKRLAELAQQTRKTQARLATLKAEAQAQTAALDEDKSALASEVRAAFANGGREHIKLLLNQEDPARLGRMSVYYRLFSERRAQAIERVVAQLEALKATVASVASASDELDQLSEKTRAERAALATTRSERQALVARMDVAIRAGNGERAALEREQTRLEGLLEELQQILKDFPVASREPFPRLKGELAWPLNGPLLADYGQPRAGAKVKWNGVLVGAERGTAVRAIARGRVAYADWLPGLGLLTVIEHSDGYISLYGYNETLAREAGEWVDAGDLLATVGDSGGQSRTALYFEIRRGRTPINPHSWFKASVASR
ncbi:MAG: peptidoglycan DD-metalloendopeptidase family protein [Pseudomonadota bacterium]